MRLFRKELFKKFPNLWKRMATPDEKEKIIQMGLYLCEFSLFLFHTDNFIFYKVFKAFVV